MNVFVLHSEMAFLEYSYQKKTIVAAFNYWIIDRYIVQQYYKKQPFFSLHLLSVVSRRVQTPYM